MQTTTYLLMQDGKVLDNSHTPFSLLYSLVADDSDWGVWIGWVNEFGEREIVACVAEVIIDTSIDVWVISSLVDQYSRMIGRVDTMRSLVRDRLRLFHSNGRFNDLANISTLTLRGCPDPQRKALTEKGKK